MQNLFESLAARYPTPARCAAALGISRQAYSQARKRRRLSESATIRAAALLDLDPGAALLANATTTENKYLSAPVIDTAENMTAALNISSPDNTNYAHPEAIKKSAHLCDNSQYVHIITSKDQQEAVDLIRWVFAVANIRADSPRFCYYVSRWRVPEKITNAKTAGTFSEQIANCPPIDPAWTRFVPDALAAYRAFIAPRTRPPESKAALSAKPHRLNAKHRRAA